MQNAFLIEPKEQLVTDIKRCNSTVFQQFILLRIQHICIYVNQKQMNY